VRPPNGGRLHAPSPMSTAICGRPPAAARWPSHWLKLLPQTMQYVNKAKQRCVMGVGMCLYAQLVQTNNTWCKNAIIMRYHPYLSGFCSRPRLTQPYNPIIYPGVAKIYLVFFWKCLL